MAEVPTYAVMPTRDRHGWVAALVARLEPDCDAVVVLDNGSDPPMDVQELGGRALVLRDCEQPPNIARMWNLCFDVCHKLAAEVGVDRWNIAVLNDDALLPLGWLASVTGALREHPSAAAAHSGAGRRITAPYLLTELDNDVTTRLCPHAFVVRGELGLRADESMLWWFSDTDFDWQCRLAGGVLGVPGPRAANGLANSTTVGWALEQAQRDEATFRAKWDVS